MLACSRWNVSPHIVRKSRQSLGKRPIRTPCPSSLPAGSSTEQAVNRRLLLALSGTLLLGGCSAAASNVLMPEPVEPEARPGFVQARGHEFWLDGRRYAFAGVNLWY